MNATIENVTGVEGREPEPSNAPEPCAQSAQSVRMEDEEMESRVRERVGLDWESFGRLPKVSET